MWLELMFREIGRAEHVIEAAPMLRQRQHSGSRPYVCCVNAIPTTPLSVRDAATAE